jgi:phosphoribosylpyrophosphate synthetase
MLLFSGSSTNNCKQVAESLKCKLGTVDLNRFSDGEMDHGSPILCDQTVFVLQRFQPMNDHIMEFILMGDAILVSPKKNGWYNSILVMPDKINSIEQEPVSARVIANSLK